MAQLFFVFLHVLLEHLINPSLRTQLVFIAVASAALLWIRAAERRAKDQWADDGAGTGRWG